ncbi:MAG: hypothetical protein P1U56_15590 [Saprospiraceae bacterium]|nr:hypothetical protein [Saprospiraceae bacterium]
MKNDGRSVQTNDQIKELLYIEMIGQQMQAFIDIDNLISKQEKSAFNPKSKNR